MASLVTISVFLHHPLFQKEDFYPSMLYRIDKDSLFQKRQNYVSQF